MSTTITVRVDDELTQQLNAIAKSAERSRSFIIKKALELYVANQAELQIALDRLHDTNDKIISMESMKAELDV